MALGVDPERAILVELGPIRRASDLDGLNAVRLSNAPQARHALRNRLSTAGCEVDQGSGRWLEPATGGDFEAALQAAHAPGRPFVAGSPDTSRAMDELKIELERIDEWERDELQSVDHDHNTRGVFHSSFRQTARGKIEREAERQRQEARMRAGVEGHSE